MDGVSQDALRRINSAVCSHYTYRGVRCLKNPFDLALYQMLITREQIRCVIEIGSAYGGSAIWFADQLALNDVSPFVISVDLKPPDGVQQQGVYFRQGDALDLVSVFPGAMTMLPRPLLVIEDAAHTYACTTAVLDFFRDKLVPGDYMVVEDGIVHDLGMKQHADGPRRATRDFLKRHKGFEVDRFYCDFFGPNVTWNPDGYLKRV